MQSEFFRYIASLFVYGGAFYWLVKVVRGLVSPPTDVSLAVEIESATGKFNSGLSTASEFVSGKIDTGTSETLKKLTVSSIAKTLESKDIKLGLKLF